MAGVKVAVRVRPLNKRELSQGCRVIVTVGDGTISIHNMRLGRQSGIGDSRDRIKRFSYDYIYWSVDPLSENYASQEMIFQDLGTGVLQAAFQGYNACIFAYGQTGSGKTHTMMGHPPDQAGLIPRICEGLFNRINNKLGHNEEERVSYKIRVSYLEIYNERVRDLLLLPSSRQTEKYSLRVREHPKEGPYVQDLSHHAVKDYQSLQALIDKGNNNRTTAATHMHDKSSRSHAIFTISFIQANLDEEVPSEMVSKIRLVDLAGSERADPTDKYNKGRLKEGANINKSLVTLGNVIQALAERTLLEWSSDRQSIGSDQSNHSGSTNGSTEKLCSPRGSPRRRRTFIPYRDSVLTWLLKDSLGGNSKTVMIATVSPSDLFCGETISTLRYAQRAKSIINKPTVNEDANVRLIRELRAEIVRLRTMLAGHWQSNLSVNPREFKNTEIQAGSLVSLSDTSSCIVEKLEENESKARELTKSWIDKWQETHEIMRDTDMSIRPLSRRSSLSGIIVDSQLPHLICVDDDILTTGVVLYHLQEGDSYVGTEDSARDQDIVLVGPDVVAEHCVIKHTNGKVTLHPNPGAFVTVNNTQITLPVQLSQGDVIKLGRNNVFRFNNPQEAARLRERRQSLNGESPVQCTHAMSRCASAGSLSTSTGPDLDTLNCVTPLSPLHGGLEMKNSHSMESESLECAREELERLQEEHRHVTEVCLDDEEEMWREHTQHKTKVEEHQQLVSSLVKQHELAREQAEYELQEMKRRLEEEKQSHELAVEAEVHKLDELESRVKVSQTSDDTTHEQGIQTRPAEVDESGIQTDDSQFTDRMSGSGMSADTEDAQIQGRADVYGAELYRLRDSIDEQKRKKKKVPTATLR